MKETWFISFSGMFRLVAGSFLLMGCLNPKVVLETPEPVKIDVNMRMDVYTHGGEGEAKEGGKKGVKEGENGITPSERRRDRMVEVQTLKNDRVIGEGNDGFLSIRNMPDEPKYQKWAKQVVERENADRKLIYSKEAESKGRLEEMVFKDYGKRLGDASFPGEWIQKENGEWEQK